MPRADPTNNLLEQGRLTLGPVGDCQIHYTLSARGGQPNSRQNDYKDKVPVPDR